MKSDFDYADLLACGRSILFGEGNAQLPLPPMLMFDRISYISETTGEYNKGQVKATLQIANNPGCDWFFSCHFKNDPVMPGCLILDALWQLTGFFLGWKGYPGRGRAFGVGEVKLSGMITREVNEIEYVVDIRNAKAKLAISDGKVLADHKVVCVANKLKVGLL